MRRKWYDSYQQIGNTKVIAGFVFSFYSVSMEKKTHHQGALDFWK